MSCLSFCVSPPSNPLVRSMPHSAAEGCDFCLPLAGTTQGGGDAEDAHLSRNPAGDFGISNLLRVLGKVGGAEGGNKVSHHVLEDV